MIRRRFPVILQGFALVLAAGLALCLPPIARADSPGDGLGTIGVSTAGPVLAASTGNALTFTYTADPSSGITAGTVEIAVPDGWTAPQTADPSAPGYVSAGAVPVSAAAGDDGTGGTITLSGLTLIGGGQVQISYTDATAPSGGPSTFTTSEGDGLDTPIALAGQPAVQVLAPDGSGTVTVDPASAVAGSDQSFGFTYTADPGGLQGGTLQLAIPSGWTAPQTVDSGQPGFVATSLGLSDDPVDQAGSVTVEAGGLIQVTGVSLAAGDTLLLAYDDVTAPAADSYTFTADESSAGGSTQPISDQPQVTVTPIIAPGAPSLSSPTPEDGQVGLSWSAPTDDGGGSVTDYLINEYEGGDTSGPATVIDTSSPSTTADVQGLTNGQPYTFTVQAVNSAGPGPASAPVSVTPATVPGSPSLSSVMPGDSQVTLSWSAPTDDGGASVSDYIVTEYPGGDTSGTPTAIDTRSNSTSYTVPGLTDGQSYSFTVVAVNAVGGGSPSGSLSTTPRTVPGAPTLTAIPGPGRVSLSWTAPADGGDAIDHYVISEYAGAEATGTPTTTTTTSTSTSQTVTGLADGSAYTFEIQAVNGAGAGGASNAETVTPATVAAAPKLLATVAGPGLVEVVWSPPGDDGGAAISAYDVFRATTPGATGTEIATQAPATSTNTYIDQTVTNGTTYYYEIVAVNRVGQSPASNQIAAEPTAVLTPPLLVETITVAGHRVTFSAPNQCVRAGRVAGKLTISSAKTARTKVAIARAVFEVGKLAKRTIARRRPSAAGISVTLRVKRMASRHSYPFLAQLSIASGKGRPHRHTLRLRITAC